MMLYDFERSGNCYKIRLFLSLLALRYETHPIDLRAGESTSEAFLKINAKGQIPVLIDQDIVLPDSSAILVYLAKKYADDSWFPQTPIKAAHVVRWMTFEQNEIRYGLARARAVSLKNNSEFAQTGRLDECQRIGRAALHQLEQQLTNTTWLVAHDTPTLADIACYPYTALASEGGLNLDDYPAIQRWFHDLQSLPGYLALP